MTKREKLDYRTAGAPPQVVAAPFGSKWYGKLLLIVGSIGLLTLAFAPIGQFYLAWVGLIPWLCVLRRTRSQRAAFFWSWLGGTGFFVANMWWMAYVTVPGMLALLAYCGIYWAVAGVIVRGAGLLDLERPWWGGPRILARILLVGAVWTGLEFVRGVLVTGLPWLFLGHTQTPILRMCQIADLLGVYGVTFWVVCLNALLAFWLFERLNFQRLRVAGGMIALMLGVIFAYGSFRRSQLPACTVPGPVVMVVQPNYPQDNKSGEKAGELQERIDFHLGATDTALAAGKGRVSLVVWSETIMPELNGDARSIEEAEALKVFLARYPLNKPPPGPLTLPQYAFDGIAALGRAHGASVLTGALYLGDWRQKAGKSYLSATDRRNSAFLILPSGGLSDERYDKHHLVPFGEFVPFRDSVPWLYRIFLTMSPYDFDYTLNCGPEDALTVFRVEPRAEALAASQPAGSWKSTRPARFVVPICFEDIDARLTARMFRPRPSEGPGKRADFIVNLTNDGWFKANEPSQHLQAAVFRSIENRAPTARSVNTGISGFIDSYGEVTGTIAKDHEGTLSQQLRLDNRLTWYTQLGDLFAIACVTITTTLAGVAFFLRRRPPGAPHPDAAPKRGSGKKPETGSAAKDSGT